eukprot:1131134-Pyramimonas_sp.AAC.1
MSAPLSRQHADWGAKAADSRLRRGRPPRAHPGQSPRSCRRRSPMRHAWLQPASPTARASSSRESPGA